MSTNKKREQKRERRILARAQQAAILEALHDENNKALQLDGFEPALLGIGRRCGQPSLAVYSREKCIKILVRGGMSREDAEEYFSFNTEGAWAGEGTPIIVDDEFS